MNKTTLPAAIESMIEGLVDPNKNRYLKETHKAMMQRSIEALQQAINEYDNQQRKR